MGRLYHHWEKWECYPAGFFNTEVEGHRKDEAQEAYADFLGNLRRFEEGINHVFHNWPHSCDQFLSNPSRNRVAWIGQSAACAMLGLPSIFRGGFRLLSSQDQDKANGLAAQYLSRWLEENGKREHAPPTMTQSPSTRIEAYEQYWMQRGYPDGIPDEVPYALFKLGLAPSWKSAAWALLSNDVNLYTLGFPRPQSEWYGAIKRHEIAQRTKA